MQRLKLFDMPFGPFETYAEIHTAVINDDYEKLERLLKNGANPDQADQDEGWTPLMWAVANRRLDFIELLLKYGADPNVRSDHGTTPISHCMKVAPCDYMLEHMWNPKPSRERYIELVAREHYLTTQIISALLNYRADPYIKNKSDEDAFSCCHNNYYRELLINLTQVINVTEKVSEALPKKIPLEII